MLAVGAQHICCLPMHGDVPGAFVSYSTGSHFSSPLSAICIFCNTTTFFTQLGWRKGFMFFMLHSTQTSKQHFKKNIVLPEVFLNSGSVRLKLNKLMKHSIFHYRQCYSPALESWWQAAHMRNMLFIFLKFVHFFRILYMRTVFISFVPLPLSPPYPLLTRTFWIYGLLFFSYYCYMCVCVRRKVDRRTDRQADHQLSNLLCSSSVVYMHMGL